MPRSFKKIPTQQQTVPSPSGEIPFLLARSPRRRTIEISVKSSSQVMVRAPRYASDREIRSFVLEKADWITLRLREARLNSLVVNSRKYQNGSLFLFLGREYPLLVQPTPARQARLVFNNNRWDVFVPQHLTPGRARDTVKRRLVEWYKGQAREVFGVRVFQLARGLGLDPLEVAVRTQKRIWGCCDPRGRKIHLNWHLVMAPLEVMDYVIVHELCHLWEANHSARFWRRVAEAMPDFKRSRDWLKRHQLEMTLP